MTRTFRCSCKVQRAVLGLPWAYRRGIGWHDPAECDRLLLEEQARQAEREAEALLRQAT